MSSSSTRAELGTLGPACIVIDTVNRSLAGSESDDRDMGAYIKAADYLRDAFGCLVLLVHHCGVDASRPRAVKVATWREALFSRGVLNREAKNPREDFSRIKRALLARHLAGERDGLVWAVTS